VRIQIEYFRQHSSLILSTAILILFILYGYLLVGLYNRPNSQDQLEQKNLTALQQESETQRNQLTKTYARINSTLTQQYGLTPDKLEELYNRLKSNTSDYELFLTKLNNSPLADHTPMARKVLAQIIKDTNTLNKQLARAKKVQTSLENLLIIQDPTSTEYAFASGILENQLIELTSQENLLYYSFRYFNIPSFRKHAQNLIHSLRHPSEADSVSNTPPQSPIGNSQISQINKTNDLYPFSLAEMRSYVQLKKISLIEPRYHRENDQNLKNKIISKYISYATTNNALLKGIYRPNETIISHSKHANALKNYTFINTTYSRL